MRTLSTRRRRSGDRGQGLTEFAIVIPVFLLVMFAIFDFGFMLYSRLTVANATREAARAAVMVAYRPSIRDVVDATVKSVSFALTTSRMVIESDCVPVGSCDVNANPKPGDSVQVTVTYQYQTFFPWPFIPPLNLSSTVQMVLE